MVTAGLFALVAAVFIALPVVLAVRALRNTNR
jgi:hypothetical protein